MILVFLLFLPIASPLDFRSQAYKNADIYSQQPMTFQQSAQQVSNPYMQFAPNTGQSNISPSLPTASQSYSNSNQNFGSTEAQKSSESVDYANLYNKLTSAALSVAAQPSFPLAGILPISSELNPQQLISSAPESNQRPIVLSATTDQLSSLGSQTNWQTNAQQNQYSGGWTSSSYQSASSYEATTTTESTPPPVIWTTKKPTTKLVAKMSKLSKPLRKEAKNSTTAAQVIVPSHRLLNDILVLPSTRRLYVLVLLPIHESQDNKGFECGKVDVNGFIRLAAFMDALEQVNSQPILRDAGLGLGAVIVDSCSSDLRTVADLYELLSGTNIQKSDLIAMIRDDGSYLPNVDDFARHLKIPIINTFFSTREQFMATGTLPSIVSPLETMISLLTHTQSDCVSIIYDDLYEESAKQMSDMAFGRGVCIEQKLNLKGDSLTLAESAVRRLLLTEARIVVVLLGEGSWIQLMKALRTEMVIAGRFIMITVQHPRWFTSQSFLEMWPHFDQLLLTVTNKKPKQSLELQHLNSRFPSFPFPQHWMRQFWSTAFHCHIEGENESGQQFSKECSDKQVLNLTTVAPDIDIAPITLAVHTIAHATRKLVDNVCPGALVQSLHDCLNDPQESLFSSIMALRFPNPMIGDIHFNETSGYRDSSMIVNRVVYDSQMEIEELAHWDTVSGFTYTSALDLVMEERDGTRVPLRSSCPRSSCASELAKRSQSGFKPSFNDSLSNTYLLIYTIGAVFAFFICMLCMYHQIVCSRDDNYSICTILLFAGLSLLCLVSVFFIMKPNAISCICRRIAFSISLSFVFAPVLVKTLAVWKLELSFEQNRNAGQVQRPNQHTLFWIIMAVVTIQAVISSEWSLFESPTEITFTSSVQHGHQWRCAPGDQFEQRLLHSCSLSGLMIIITLVCSILSVRHIESRQNILIAILGGIFGLGLYLGLPLLPYTLRDQVIAGSALLYSLIIIIITYCRGAFSKDDDDSNKSLVGKSTLDRSEKNPYWLDNLVLSPRSQQAMSLQRNYHHVHTLPANIHTVEKFAHETYTTPRPIHSTNTHPPRLDNKAIPRLIPSTLQRPQRNSAPYGIESYELPPLSPNHQVQYQSQTTLPYGAKYGKDEYVTENEEGENCRL